MQAIKILKKYFPVSAIKNDVKSLVIAIVIYVVASAIFGLIIGILHSIPVINWVAGIAGSLVGIYCLVGIIISFLDFFGMTE